MSMTTSMPSSLPCGNGGSILGLIPSTLGAVPQSAVNWTTLKGDDDECEQEVEDKGVVN